MLLFLCFLSPVSSQQLGTNTSTMREYLPPDIYYFPPGKLLILRKLDLNKASYQQLIALPQINEDLALKIISKRPIKTLDDLYKLPFMNKDRMQVIISGIANFVTQPVKKDESVENLQQ